MTANENTVLTQVAHAYSSARDELTAQLIRRWGGVQGLTPGQASARMRELQIIKQIDDRISQLERQLGVILRGSVDLETENGIDSIRRQIEALPEELRPDLTRLFDKVPTRMIERFVPVVMQDVALHTGSMSLQIQSELQSGLIQGKSFDRLVASIFSTAPNPDDGPAIWRNGEVSVERMARRTVITVGNAAHQDAIASVAKQDPLIQKQAIAVIGPNTTDCCLRVHGQIRNYDEPFDLVGTPRFANQMMFPSFHWNCRTQSAMYHPAFEKVTSTSSMIDMAKEEAKNRQTEYTAPTQSAARAGKASESASDTPVRSISWSPMMSREDAEAWSRDSAVQGTYFHTTSKKASEGIRSSGFELGTSNSQYYGQGVYLSRDKSIGFYGDTPLEVKINVRNPYVHMPTDDPTTSEFLGKISTSPIGPEVQAELEKNPNQRKFEAVTKVLQSKGYDSVVAIEDKDPILVVFDPRNVTVVDHTKPVDGDNGIQYEARK